tara:strand:- start:729 stop:1208 length:480 start_codon:yes stop_codon:yes gene_type:complete
MVRKLPKRAFEDVAFVEAQVSSFQMDERDGGMWKLIFYVEDLGNADWLVNCYPRTSIVMGIKALDYDNPDRSGIDTEGERALKKAGMLCRDARFQQFMKEYIAEDDLYVWGVGKDEEMTVKVLHSYLHVDSRREIPKDWKKISALNDLIKQFEDTLRRK